MLGDGTSTRCEMSVHIVLRMHQRATRPAPGNGGGERSSDL